MRLVTNDEVFYSQSLYAIIGWYQSSPEQWPN